MAVCWTMPIANMKMCQKRGRCSIFVHPAEHGPWNSVSLGIFPCCFHGRWSYPATVPTSGPPPILALAPRKGDTPWETAGPSKPTLWWKSSINGYQWGGFYISRLDYRKVSLHETGQNCCTTSKTPPKKKQFPCKIQLIPPRLLSSCSATIALLSWEQHQVQVIASHGLNPKNLQSPEMVRFWWAWGPLKSTSICHSE